MTSSHLQPANPGGWGVDTAPDMRTASALIGACAERCAPCQQTLAAKLLDEDPIVLSLHPQYASAILNGDKTVELRRQRVAVPAGTPVIIYATSPVMALTGTARLTAVDSAPPAQLWRRHKAACGLSKAEYTRYMDGATQASALLLDHPRPLSSTVPLAHLRATSAFHPPQSYRYLTQEALRELVSGHEAAGELLDRLAMPRTAGHTHRSASPQPARAYPARASDSMRSAVLLTAGPW
ncbi:ASCH domain-containing protein [Streptomyces sp. NPDC051104]|uniref:ASCH domain-containing protein n=1 Tax=Streptomyces sp. NPDC051104 TaxID=3155044 RepID=UPI003445C960